MAQSGRRGLPTNASILLSRLLLLHLNTPENTVPTQAEVTQLKASIAKKLSNAQMHLVTTQKKLATLQTNYHKANKLLQVANAMLQNAVVNKDAKKEKLWATVMVDDALKKLKTNSKAKQTLLQIKVNCLLYEIELANQYKQ